MHEAHVQIQHHGLGDLVAHYIVHVGADVTIPAPSHLGKVGLVDRVQQRWRIAKVARAGVSVGQGHGLALVVQLPGETLGRIMAGSTADGTVARHAGIEEQALAHLYQGRLGRFSRR